MDDAKLVRHFSDLWFTALATPGENWVEFAVYEIDEWEDGEEPQWHRKDGDSSPDPVAAMEDAEVYLHGSVKRDGCSNWMFDEEHRGTMLHACTRRGLLRFSEVMTRCWDWAKELLPNFEGNVGER